MKKTILLVVLGLSVLLNMVLITILVLNRPPGPPHVVSISPANGSANVDTNLTEIRVVFDRPMMNSSWSLCGGGPKFPEIAGDLHYDAKRTTWTAPVKLKPGMAYEFWLNSESYRNFKSAKGVSLESVHVTFSTAP